MTRRRRIWCELLPAEELASPATVALLERFQLEPILAFPPERDDGPYLQALGTLARAGRPFGVWPLLADHHGYWPSVENVAAFQERVQVVLQQLERVGARPRTVAFDLEPPLQRMKPLMHGGVSAARTLWAEGRRALTAPQKLRQAEAGRALHGIARSIEAQGIETLAAVLPPVVLDLAGKGSTLQALFGTPVFHPEFQVVSPMMYTTLISALIPFGHPERARGLLYEGGKILAQRLGPGRASLSLGLVSPGKLQDEPAYADPSELAKDVAAARATGIDDLALYALEGVLARGDPEVWLTAFTEVDAAAPAVGAYGHTLRTLAKGLTLARRRR
ncbi:MAG: hypothetical protein IPG45_23015 [Deltaproteobacteria bacterium]|jgi:hypothetical protein|nr:hypothetical protein [Deltaproteobacteria bacterium]